MKYDEIRTAKRVKAPAGKLGTLLSWGSDYAPPGGNRPSQESLSARVRFDDGTESEVLIRDLEKDDGQT